MRVLGARFRRAVRDYETKFSLRSSRVEPAFATGMREQSSPSTGTSCSRRVVDLLLRPRCIPGILAQQMPARPFCSANDAPARDESPRRRRSPNQHPGSIALDWCLPLGVCLASVGKPCAEALLRTSSRTSLVRIPYICTTSRVTSVSLVRVQQDEDTYSDGWPRQGSQHHHHERLRDHYTTPQL